ncbi:MAG TPA: CDP-alcohol phosphatidyltransferase family protein [Gammaproteobacteria bacterium]
MYARSSVAFDALRRLHDAVVAVALLTAVLAVVAVVAQRGFALRGLYVPLVLAAFLAGAVVALLTAARQLHGTFGAANHVTLARGALTSLVGGLLVAESSTPVLWFAIAVAGAALALDGLDGSLARRRGVVTAFGARFDMETDALTILVLAALVWRFGKADAWVLLIGLMRYAFVAAGSRLPWMRAPLPPSRRRQTVCVLQVAALLLCLAPFTSPARSTVLAAAALAALVASFAIDTAWLARRAASARV